MPALDKAQYERFCREYVVHHNGAKAAAAAGFAKHSARVRASILLRRPEVAARVRELELNLLSKADITAERVMLELGRVAFSDPRKLVDATGRVRPIHELDDDAAASLAAFEVDAVTTTVKGGKKSTTVHTAKVRRYEKTPALGILAQHFKLIGTNIDETVSAALAVAERLAQAKARLKRMRPPK